MSRCVAPVRGHSSAADACPVCRDRRSGYGNSRPYSAPSYFSSGSSSDSSSSSSRPRWSSAGSSLSYTSDQVQSLTPIRETV
ncbi:hypothetical protein QN360_01070 [Glaciimonas sp. CA11.2]|uniref:hypothetical protein n=1 Tax=Glaciimonas sp. CA11.2 TaxID=3048601 RepID=UPI002B2249A2|nr:hypothetical protein [Glaciimonas sp. CA11.2]MEB0161498.1 hypothetical protein [Glaciimonas sp. CA11.2]